MSGVFCYLPVRKLETSVFFSKVLRTKVLSYLFLQIIFSTIPPPPT